MKFPQSEQALKIASALAHKPRLAILHYIHSKKTTNVGEMYRALRMGQAKCSQQLKILRNAGLVIRTADGQNRLYSLNYERIEFINNILNTINDK